jgi:protein-S-isoprenylcysteine O-methyltransferase Ste14
MARLVAVSRQLPRILRARVLPAVPVVPWLGAVLVAVGLGFSVWARRHLGRNWSANVVVKEDHALIRTGPYKHLRHPIYSGVLLAFLGLAITINEWRGLLAFALVFVSFARKSWVEEQRMREVFPEYEQYRRESAAIIRSYGSFRLSEFTAEAQRTQRKQFNVVSLRPLCLCGATAIGGRVINGGDEQE